MEKDSEIKRLKLALIEANRQVNAANQAKSNFLATVSHELRTPLNPILGFSDLLLEEIEDEEQLEMVRSINEAGQVLVETVNHIIEYAELDPEKSKLSQDHILHTMLIDEVVSDVRERYPSFSIELSIEQDPVLPEGIQLIGDIEKVKSVFSNLLENAAKFSGVDSVKLHSVLRSMDSQRVLWHVDVQDGGEGIDATLLDAIFDPFLVGKNTYTRTQRGAGMGLAICRGYVELMDGQISVQSQKGVGTTFSFFVSLPIVVNNERQGEKESVLASG